MSDDKDAEIARLNARVAEMEAALRIAKDALLSDPPNGPQKSIYYSDDVIYHLDGQTCGHALQVVRAALTAKEGEAPAP